MSKPGTGPRAFLGTLGVLAAAGFIVAAALFGARAFTSGAPDGEGIGGPFTLVAGDGKIVTDQTYRGKWLLVYFGYTHCPDACPTTLNSISLAMNELGPARRQKVQTLFVSVDPKRDTPALLKDYVANFAPDFVGLTGNAAQLAGVEDAYKIYVSIPVNATGNYPVGHSSLVYVMDPTGTFVTSFTEQTTPDAMAAQLKNLMGS